MSSCISCAHSHIAYIVSSCHIAYVVVGYLTAITETMTYRHSSKPECQSILVDGIGDVLGECHWLVCKVGKLVLSCLE